MAKKQKNKNAQFSKINPFFLTQSEGNIQRVLGVGGDCGTVNIGVTTRPDFLVIAAAVIVAGRRHHNARSLPDISNTSITVLFTRQRNPLQVQVVRSINTINFQINRSVTVSVNSSMSLIEERRLL